MFVKIHIDWKQVRAILLLPGTVTILIPAVLLIATESLNPGWGLVRPINLLLDFAGLGLIGFGLLFLVKSARTLTRLGQGTIAPWDPTQRLVVQGLYRQLRNPMISSVFCILIGETLLLGSVALLGWLGVFFILNLIYIPLAEEPMLEKRFGEQYQDYKRNVPRWIPRHAPFDSKVEGMEGEVIAPNQRIHPSNSGNDS